jgi:hypothetical protein
LIFIIIGGEGNAKICGFYRDKTIILHEAKMETKRRENVKITHRSPSGCPSFLPRDLTNHSPHYFQEIHIFFTIFKVSDSIVFTVAYRTHTTIVRRKCLWEHDLCIIFLLTPPDKICVKILAFADKKRVQNEKKL